LKKHLSILIFIQIILFSCNEEKNNELTIELNDWILLSEFFSDSIEAIIPGCVHLDLLENNIIDDPFFGENESKLQWIDTISWSYMTSFYVDLNNFKDYNHQELIFEGIDTQADIILNADTILHSNNMYKKWTIDISKNIVQGENRLEVCFLSSKSMNETKAAALSYLLPDNRVFSRKAPYHFGWDWGPEFVTSGIWRPVYLKFWNDVQFDHYFIQTKELKNDFAEMQLSFESDSENESEFLLELIADNEVVIHDKINLIKGKNRIEIPFQIKEPKLWWCNGMGDSYLYDFVIKISDSNSIIETKKIKVGIRTVELIEEKDLIGQSFKFKLNGEDIFIKGANYIPLDNFVTRVDRSKYRKVLQSAKDVNMNMLRVWGGGIYEDEMFYELCDSLGILVWQDFMFACAMYPGDSTFIQNVTEEIDYQIKRLRNHTSIALWCGNNEVDNGWKDWGWQKQLNYSREDSLKIWNDYEKLFHEIIPTKLNEQDTTRNYWPSSPKFGWGHEEANQEGDSHYWGVWWGEEPFEVFQEKVPRFMSEYGFQAFPVISTIDSFTSPNQRFLYSDELKMHQKHPRGFQLIDKYMNWYFPVPNDFEKYIYTSQLLQTYGMEMAIESHRLNKPYCMGTLYWQLNDCWPVVSWSTIDYYGSWKASHYYLKRLYNNILIASSKVDNRIDLYLVSDLKAVKNGSFEIQIVDMKGNVIKEFQKEQQIKDSSILITSLDKLEFENRKELVIVSIYNVKNEEEIRAIDHFVKPKNLKLIDPSISYFIEELDDRIFINLTSKCFAKSVMINIQNHNYQFSDNYFDLLPDELKRIEVLDCVESISNEQVHIISLFDLY
jgi:beta-mannosidase